jgi:hypothetical protein
MITQQDIDDAKEYQERPEATENVEIEVDEKNINILQKLGLELLITCATLQISTKTAFESIFNKYK